MSGNDLLEEILYQVNRDHKTRYIEEDDVVGVEVENHSYDEDEDQDESKSAMGVTSAFVLKDRSRVKLSDESTALLLARSFENALGIKR